MATWYTLSFAVPTYICSVDNKQSIMCTKIDGHGKIDGHWQALLSQETRMDEALFFVRKCPFRQLTAWVLRAKTSSCLVLFSCCCLCLHLIQQELIQTHPNFCFSNHDMIMRHNIVEGSGNLGSCTDIAQYLGLQHFASIEICPLHPGSNTRLSGQQRITVTTTYTITADFWLAFSRSSEFQRGIAANQGTLSAWCLLTISPVIAYQSEPVFCSVLSILCR